jgi:hypothetical protein
MRWAHGVIDGREVGYGVDAVCDRPDCSTKIDRGVDFRCGGPYSDYGCGGYFCYAHLFTSLDDDEGEQYCGLCDWQPDDPTVDEQDVW